MALTCMRELEALPPLFEEDDDEEEVEGKDEDEDEEFEANMDRSTRNTLVSTKTYSCGVLHAVLLR